MPDAIAPVIQMPNMLNSAPKRLRMGWTQSNIIFFIRKTLRKRIPSGAETPNRVSRFKKNNNLYLNDPQIQIVSLNNVLRQKLLTRVDKLVVIDSAPRVKYDFFARVLEDLPNQFN